MHTANIKDKPYILSVSLAHFINDFYIGLIPVISFVFYKKMSLSYEKQGLIIVVGMLTSAIFQPIFGVWFDRKDRSKLLPFSILVASIFLGVLGLTNSFLSLLIFLFIINGASAFLHPLASGITIKKLKFNKGFSLSLFMVIGSLGGALGPAIGFPFISKIGIEKLYYLMIPGLLSFLLLHFTYKDVSVKKIVKDKSTRENSDTNYLGVIKYILISALIVFPSKFVITYGFQLLNENSVNTSYIAIILSVFMFTAPIGTVIGGIITDKYGHDRTIKISILISLFNYLLIIIFSGYPIYSLLFILVGFASSLSSSALVIKVRDLMPVKENLAVGVMFGVPSLIIAGMLMVYGGISDQFGLSTACKAIILPIFISYLVNFRNSSGKLKTILSN